MKLARVLGLAVVAATVLMASLGAGSALAVETTLCETGADSPYCKSEDRYPKETAVQASSTKVTIDMTAPALHLECTESNIEGTTSAEAGTPLPISISGWGLGPTCKTGPKSTCTVTPKESAPYSGSLSWSNHENGTLAVGSGGAGLPGWKIHCGAAVICTLSYAPQLAVNGNATIVATNESPIEKVGLCPSKAILNGTYSVSAPSIVRVARAASPPSPATGLCKTFDLYCEASDLYPAGTEMKGESSNFKIETNPGNLLGNFTCEKATITAKTTAAYGEPSVPAESTGATHSNCGFEHLGMRPVELWAPYKGSITTSEGNAEGLWEGGGAAWFVKCGTSVACTFTAPGGSKIQIEHGNPGVIRIGGMSLTMSGKLCPTSATLRADYTLSAPGPLFFENVVR